MHKFSLILISILILSGCQTPTIPAIPTNQNTATLPAQTSTLKPATPTQTIPPTSTTTLTPAPVPQKDIHYTIQAELNYSRHLLTISQTFQYSHNQPVPLETLVIVTEHNFEPNIFKLTQLTWEDGSLIKNYTLKGTRLTIPLPSPLPAGTPVKLSATYQITIPPIPQAEDTKKPASFGYTDRQTNLVDWYLFFPPYTQEKGWLVHDPWFYGENQVYDIADFDISLKLNPANPNLKIAASAPAIAEGDTWHYQINQARSFAFSISLYYTVTTRKVGDVTVLSYAFPSTNKEGEATLKYTADALELYSKLYGPYPHASLTVVEADFLDGMEFDGLFFLSKGFYNLYDGTPKGYLTFIAAHETAHQWFYAQVGNDQAQEAWLDEALCTHAEWDFYNYYYPENLVWWWDYRVDFYQPTGFINKSIYDYGSFRKYRDAVYLQGAHFLDEIRLLVGNDAYYSFLQDYVKTYARQQASSSGFFMVLSRYNNADLSSLKLKYFANLP
jgi:hypothetical protein